MSERLSWDQYFMTITLQVAERSTCTRAKVGRRDRPRQEYSCHRL